ncbi:MAG: ATP-dependent RNA helicase [Phylliscum demangeonii]|nr:MAG: ATP-dependent RNA helicase [Phylliscum demangeonii]
MEKDLYLYAVLVYHLGQRSLIFSNSISAVRRLTHLLQELGLEAQALHSQMTQKARLRAVERFSSANGKYNLLVATDVAARGLDIPHVQVVVHYHLPRTADMYVHRSGRTARRDESGSSVLLCAPDEVVGMRRLVAKVHASSEHESRKAQRHIRPLNLDRQIVARLKPRVTLAKQITDSMLAKEKKGSEDGWLQAAAAELGVDYDSEEFEAAKGTRKGRGTGRLKAAREARSLTKADIGALRATLKRMLQDRINLGVSERYLTAGQVNIDELLEKGTAQHFLGTPTNLGLGVG